MCTIHLTEDKEKDFYKVFLRVGINKQLLISGSFRVKKKQKTQKLKNGRFARFARFTRFLPIGCKVCAVVALNDQGVSL